MKAKLIFILALTLSILLVITPTPTRASGVPGDINGDGKVNILDVTLAAGQYLLTPDDQQYNVTIVEKVDFAEPYEIITILDLVTLISYYTG